MKVSNPIYTKLKTMFEEISTTGKVKEYDKKNVINILQEADARGFLMKSETNDLAYILKKVFVRFDNEE